MKIRPRFSLRNQHKIKQSLGSDFHFVLMRSIRVYFDSVESMEDIKEHEYASAPYKVIHVPNIQPNTDSTFELYVISKTYNVFNLAYKSCFS